MNSCVRENRVIIHQRPYQLQRQPRVLNDPILRGVNILFGIRRVSILIAEASLKTSEGSGIYRETAVPVSPSPLSQ
jgi:hypothetical protein